MNAKLAAKVATVAPWMKALVLSGSLAAVVGASVYLKLGQYTFAQHMRRIWQTPEFTELRTAVTDELGSAKRNAVRELQLRLAASQTAGDE